MYKPDSLSPINVCNPQHGVALKYRFVAVKILITRLNSFVYR